MKRFSTGGTYLNFLTHDKGAERVEAASGRAVPRLAEIKARWDPQNVFRTNRNVEPVSADGSAPNGMPQQTRPPA